MHQLKKKVQTNKHVGPSQDLVHAMSTEIRSNYLNVP